MTEVPRGQNEANQSFTLETNTAVEVCAGLVAAFGEPDSEFVSTISCANYEFCNELIKFD